MKNRDLTVLIVSTDAMQQAPRWRIPRWLVIAGVAFMVLGGIGLVRTLSFAGSYAVSWIGVHGEQRKNAQLVGILDFLQRLADVHESKIGEMAAVEDRTRLRLGLNTISEDMRKAGVGGAPTLEEVVVASLTDPMLKKAEDIHQTIASLLREADLQKSTYAALQDYVNRQKIQWAQQPSVWPVRGRITSGFGYRLHPVVGERMFHEGVDIANEEWTPVLATADGLVSFAGRQQDYGNVVIINHHGNGFETVYGHLRQIAVEEGQIASRGQLIGYMGTTGRSTGTHLHYEVRSRGAYSNPLNYILPLDVVVE